MSEDGRMEFHGIQKFLSDAGRTVSLGLRLFLLVTSIIAARSLQGGQDCGECPNPLVELI